MANKFYTRNSDQIQLKIYNEISNGVILTQYDSKTGTSFANSGYQVFVTKEELKTQFTPFEFKLDSTESQNKIIVSALNEVLYQLKNYGLLEDQVRNFEEFKGHSPLSCSVLHDMVKNPKVEFEDFIGENSDDYYFSEAEEIFPFLQGGLIPILKKMLIEAEQASK